MDEPYIRHDINKLYGFHRRCERPGISNQLDLSNNPVNLSDFIEFFGNSERDLCACELRPGSPVRSPEIIAASPPRPSFCSRPDALPKRPPPQASGSGPARTANLVPRAIDANTGKCVKFRSRVRREDLLRLRKKALQTEKGCKSLPSRGGDSNMMKLDRSDRNHAPECAIFRFPIPPPRRSRHDGNRKDAGA